MTRRSALGLRLIVVAFVVQLSGCGQNDPARTFREITGIDLSSESDVSVTLMSDDHGGFFGDGELTLVVEAPKSVVDGIANAAPPWGNPTWENGPVPHAILTNCIQVRDLKPNPFESTKILFAARDRGPSSTPWHNGDVVVLDSEHGKIYLVSWDN